VLGRRLFVAGLVLMAAFVLAHLGGFLQSAHAARHDRGLTDLTRAMQEHKTSPLGFRPSILDFREYFSVNFSILLLLAAAIGYVTLGRAPIRGRSSGHCRRCTLWRWHCCSAPLSCFQ